MATNSEFTTSLSPRKRSVYSSETRDFSLFLDGQFVGIALTPDAAEAELDRLAYERLNHGQVATPPASEPVSAAAEIPDAPVEDASMSGWTFTLLPSAESVTEALDALAAIPSDTAPLFFHARARLHVGVRVVSDLSISWIDGVAVRHDPARVGWPWVCACGRPRCWHAALAEGLMLAASAQSDDSPLERAA